MKRNNIVIGKNTQIHTQRWVTYFLPFKIILMCLKIKKEFTRKKKKKRDSRHTHNTRGEKENKRVCVGEQQSKNNFWSNKLKDTVTHKQKADIIYQ